MKKMTYAKMPEAAGWAGAGAGAGVGAGAGAGARAKIDFSKMQYLPFFLHQAEVQQAVTLLQQAGAFQIELGT
jgi:hypothetical protein